jgi:cytochrome b involved in lipid metabolism
MRIPPSVLKQHNKRDDAWMALYGKVYNVTAYMPYHPGGEKELMRAAGRDGTKLFGTLALKPSDETFLLTPCSSRDAWVGECRVHVRQLHGRVFGARTGSRF